MNKSKVAIITSQIWQVIEMILGIIITGFFVLGLLCTEDKNSVLSLCLFFIAIGSFLIYKSVTRKKLIKCFKKYVQILAGDPFNSLDNIAENTNTSVEVVKKNIEKMIKKNYFANAKIDDYSNSLVLNGKPDIQQVIQEKAQENTSKPATGTSYRVSEIYPEIEFVSVKCKGCGGINAIPRGQTAECEYCGNMLKGE